MLKETGYLGVDRIHLAEDKNQLRVLVIPVINIQLQARNLLTSWATNKFLKKVSALRS
jgi:hypothetical protein